MEIKVKETETAMGWRFSVTILDTKGEQNYNVSMDKDFLLRVGSHYDPTKLVQKSFEFLLEREPKERILPEFDISTLAHHYPGFTDDIISRMDFS